jgi:hypothetical protein
MDRPLVYEDGYVVNRNMPYEMIELLPSGAHLSGGVLAKGKRVWMQHESQGPNYCHAVSVYAEDIGIVSLDPYSLSRLD